MPLHSCEKLKYLYCQKDVMTIILNIPLLVSALDLLYQYPVAIQCCIVVKVEPTTTAALNSRWSKGSHKTTT